MALKAVNPNHPILSPRVKSHLLLALVPLGLALSSAGMAALEEMYGSRRQDLADLKAEIAQEAARLDELRRDRDAEHFVDECGKWDPAAAVTVVEVFEGKADELVPAAASTT